MKHLITQYYFNGAFAKKGICLLPNWESAHNENAISVNHYFYKSLEHSLYSIKLAFGNVKLSR